MLSHLLRVISATLLSFVCIGASAQNAILIDSGSVWKYWANTEPNAPTVNWKGGGSFDDSGWPSGPAKLGYGGDGEITPINAGCGTLGNPGSCSPKYITTYFRKSFSLASKDAYSGFIIRLLRDDGAVVYVNGVEVWRSNMPTGTISYSTLAPNPAVGGNDEKTFFVSPVIPITSFQTGNNIIAVELHQNAANSSDLGFNLQLEGQLASGNALLPLGSVWKYWANTEANAPATTWTGSGAFDDSGWPSGPGRLGYGDDGEVTAVPVGCGTLPNPGNCTPKFTTTYFRRNIAITNPSQYQALYFRMTRDDGAVVYVNGVEVWRTAMPSGTVFYSTFALSDPLSESDGPNESALFFSPALAPSVFANGNNTISVEVHQVNAASSDLGFDLELVAVPLAPQTLLPLGSNWKYWANTEANAPVNWAATAFNDGAWPSGVAKLGFGGDGEVTPIPAGCGTLGSPGNCTPKFNTIYFRTTVNIANVSSFAGFAFDLIRDDGAVVYVNGVEAWRSNMPAGAIAYSTFASSLVDGANENALLSSPLIPTSLFQNGTNVIAVEVHQINAISSDLGMDLRLRGLYSIPPNEVIYMWSGAITGNSAKVNAKLTSASTQARLVVSTSTDLSSPLYGSFVPVEASKNFMASLPISGLVANTKYYYAVEADGVVDNSADDVGSFKTSNTGAFSFRFTVGGCGLSSNHPVYTKMGEKNPLLFIANGDFHYANPNSGTDINVHRQPYETNMLSQAASRNFFKNTALAYIWDDHDFSGNDTDSTAAGKTNARLAYQEYIPHYPLARGSGDVPIYQSFTIGRIHFIMTDLRSTRRQGSVIWDATQKQWFKDECLFAKANNLTIAWVSSVSFGGNQADNWGGFAADRTEISDFFKNNAIKDLFIMSGDAHMLAMDNGNNHDFSTGGNNPNKYPVFAAAALNQNGSVKGGLYNVRPDGTVDGTLGASYTYANPDATVGQYGVVDVTDNGLQLCITFTGYRVTNAGVETTLSTYNFCRLAGAPLPVKLTSFEARLKQKKVELEWKVEEDEECAGYVVEHSADGVHFRPKLNVSCQRQQPYTITDEQPVSGNNFYRLKVSERNGRHFYSGVRKVNIRSALSLIISPNPAKDVLNLNLNNESGGSVVRTSVYDMSGRVVQESNLALQNGANSHRLPLNKLLKGTYLLRVQNGNEEVSQVFVIQ